MKILVFPKDINPYQELLYQEFSNYPDVEVMYFTAWSQSIFQLRLILFPILLIRERLNGFRIFHLHWLYPFSYKHDNHVINFLWKLFFTIYMPCIFLWIKVLGYTLIWTVHNTVSHDHQTLNDTFITRFLCTIADAKIVHSKYTLEQLVHLKADIHRAYIIPIGNYNTVYPNTVSKNVARKKIDIPRSRCTFLFFGYIKKYKGIDTLLVAFAEILQDYPDIQLIIAGECHDKQLEQLIYRYKKKNQDSIIDHVKHIRNDDVQYYFNASDIVVLPFTRITTSSSALLALYFKKPIVYPLLGSLRDFPKNIGFPYEITDKDGLKNALLKAIENKNLFETFGENGLNYSKSLSWDNIAEKTYDVYKKTLL